MQIEQFSVNNMSEFGIKKAKTILEFKPKMNNISSILQELIKFLNNFL